MRDPEAIGCDHAHDAEVFNLRLALDERYVEGPWRVAWRG
jgi:hypothetical protein